CGAFVPLMTPEAAESVWVQRECHHAEKRSKPVFPLLLSGEEYPRYGLTQYNDVRDGKLPQSDFYERLAEYVPRSPKRGQDITPQSQPVPRREAEAQPVAPRPAAPPRRVSSFRMAVRLMALVIVVGGVFLVVNQYVTNVNNDQDNNVSDPPPAQRAEPQGQAPADRADESVPERMPVEYYLNVSRDLMIDGQPGQAVDLLTEGLAHYPDEVALYDQRGWAYHENEQYGRAVDDRRRAYEMNPNPGMQFWLGFATFHVGDRELAITHMTAAIDEEPDNPVFRRFMGDVWVEMGAVDMALENYSMYIDIMGDAAEPEIIELVGSLER
ncbi:MAG: tetratricopeptide repeat protein, partial [Chloroflexota bacterium]